MLMSRYRKDRKVITTTCLRLKTPAAKTNTSYDERTHDGMYIHIFAPFSNFCNLVSAAVRDGSA